MFGMVHERQGLPLDLEPGDDLGGVHPRLDDLQRHLAVHRVRLLGPVDHTHAALAQPFDQPVGADRGTQGSMGAASLHRPVGGEAGFSRKPPAS